MSDVINANINCLVVNNMIINYSFGNVKRAKFRIKNKEFYSIFLEHCWMKDFATPIVLSL